MAEDLKKEIEGLRPRHQNGDSALPVALVGREKSSFDIFHVLQELKLARPLTPTEEEKLKEEKLKTKPKNPEEKSDKKSLNRIKDKDSGKSYVVDNKPSIIISVTGDAQDLPEDHDLTLGVDSLINFFQKNQKDKANALQEWVILDRESACRAFLHNFVLNDETLEKAWIKEGFGEKKEANKCMKISYLLQKRIRELSDEFKDDLKFRKKLFEYPSVRDVMLDVTKTINDAVEFVTTQFGLDKGVGCEPNACGKRMSKKRCVNTVLYNFISTTALMRFLFPSVDRQSSSKHHLML